MAASTEISKIDKVVATLELPSVLEQIEQSLPEGVSMERFKRVTITAIRGNADLANADQTTLFASIVKCAQDGLFPDGRDAALVIYKGKVGYLPMIGGIRKIAAVYGWQIRTSVVYANDEFEYTEEPPAITHRPVRPGMDRGDLIAAYAVATHRDGRRVQTVLHPADIAKRKAKAQTDAVWKEWPAAMWEKSAGHDIFGQLSLDPADARVAHMLAADVEPADAAEMLYGPNGRAALATPAPPADEPAATPTDTLSPDDGANGGGNGQQAPAAADKPPAAAAGVPGDDEDEPVLFPNQQADLAAAAAAVAETQIPAALTGTPGVNQGRTLAEVADAGYEGEQWFGYAYRHPQKYDDGFNATLHTFLQGAKPELWAELTAEEAA